MLTTTQLLTRMHKFKSRPMPKLMLMLMPMLTLSSCLGNIVCDSYESLPSSQWSAKDTLKFLQIAIPEEGDYEGVLTMRVDTSFPYQEIGVEVRQLLYYGEEETHRAKGIKKLICDTVVCRITDEKGNADGDGISLLQYAFPVKKYHFAKGNVTDVFIRHIMTTDTIPDISEVGYLLHTTE